MLSKNRNFWLAVTLVLIVAVFLLTKYLKNDNSNFRNQLPAFAIEQVEHLSIRPASSARSIVLNHDADSWWVESISRKYEADESRINSLLQGLNQADVKYVAATDEADWPEYKTTDSAGVSVLISGEDGKLSNLVLGRFQYFQNDQANTNPYMRQQQGEMITYVRVRDEEPVYAIDGMVSLGIGKNADDYRKKIILKTDKNKLSKLVFEYPDKSFSLDKTDGSWMVEGMPADSANTAKYLSNLAFIQGKSFSDNEVSGLQLFGKLTVLSGTDSTVVKAFIQDTASYLISSSINSTNVIADNDKTLTEKIFVAPDYFKSE